MVKYARPYLEDAYFPIGLYDAPRSALGELAAAGFNTVVNADKDDPAYLAECQSLGIRLIPYVNLERIQKDVEKAGDDFTIWAWYLFDEPDLNKREPAFIETNFHAVKKADPSRPVYLTVWSPRRYADFIEFCDIFAPNPYPIVSADARKNQLRLVGYAVDAARRLAREQPVWAIIQAFWAKPWWQRNPMPEELRAMVYLALNHGAKGIVYFSYKSGDRPLTQHEDLFGMVRRLNDEMTELKPWLVVESEEGAVSPELLADDRGGIVIGRPMLSPVDCAVRRIGGRRILMVVNPDPWGKNIKLHFPEGSAKVSNVIEIFADKADSLEIRNNCIPLRFEPFQVRIFQIRFP